MRAAETTTNAMCPQSLAVVKGWSSAICLLGDLGHISLLKPWFSRLYNVTYFIK